MGRVNHVDVPTIGYVHRIERRVSKLEEERSLANRVALLERECRRLSNELDATRLELITRRGYSPVLPLEPLRVTCDADGTGSP